MVSMATNVKPTVPVDPARFGALILDMDGVITQTASVHGHAWKALFDSYLQERARRTGAPFVPFDPGADYLRYVDGKPRYDGVRDFLASRDIVLPWGDPSDAPGAETVCGLGNRKNEFFLTALREQGAQVFGGSVDFIRAARAAGMKTAVVSASRNTTEILDSAGVRDLFDAQVDGVLAAQLGLPGKPEPDTFLEAARRLGVEPARAVVVEDAQAGVQAGHAGGFGLVIGVDRVGQAAELRAHGADVVVNDLSEAAIRPSSTT
jgi:beta-phosphoglucomutase family hydrolase